MGKILKSTKAGFTMVELLIVLIIVAILAAVAAPIYSANTQRAIASDAVAAMSLIRQAEREFALRNNGSFHVVTDGALYGDTNLNVDLKVAQYFSNGAFGVAVAGSTWAVGGATIPTTVVGFPNPPVDFAIKANGVNLTTANQVCDSTHLTNCAVNASKAENMCLMMDNAGRTFVNYSANPAGTTDCSGNATLWQAY